MRNVFGNAIGTIDLRDPFRDTVEHASVVDFLERLAIDEIAAHLAHEQQHRRRVLLCRVHADRGVRCSGPARHERDARPPSELAVGLRHVRRAPFLPADDER